jgi:prepilin-type N-terminal cleavage/methylation domain-containing protein
MTRSADCCPASDETGFSLIEIVVSMFILALLAIALIPLLIQGIKTSAQSAAVASATQLVNSQLDLVRAQPSTCSGVSGAPSPSVGAPSAYRGVPLQLTVTAGACPTPTPTATTPTTLTYSVKVVRLDTGKTLAQASTLIFVNGG